MTPWDPNDPLLTKLRKLLWWPFAILINKINGPKVRS